MVALGEVAHHWRRRSLGVALDAREHRVQADLTAGEPDAFHHLPHEIVRDAQGSSREDGR